MYVGIGIVFLNTIDRVMIALYVNKLSVQCASAKKIKNIADLFFIFVVMRILIFFVYFKQTNCVFFK